MNKSVVASVLAVASLCLGSAAMAQSLQNASFESLALGDGSSLRVNSHNLAGWDVSKQADIARSQVKVVNPSEGKSRYVPDGANLASIINGAELRQSFATVAGNSYSFSFLWDAKGQDGSLKVLNGGSSGSTLFENSLLANASGKLVSRTVSFVATGALSTISFMAGTPLLNDALRGGGMGSKLLVDGLQFATTVPEPSGFAMVLAGLGALALMFRRRRLQG